ncbi:SURP and G-patch domain-containing protein 1 isoform X1 [Parasteatoda tepidariorum]|uniref:SURP and G-patch domain-containing protein 1 isoform X1 n=1 Tax=Parasteatoda tepidariorum TaxID=114398 RepID=UPI001C72940D|nr:SURP and G-patch domain-containing protein 1 isoform X1 [Parasteatoda tepidariorum]
MDRLSEMSEQRRIIEEKKQEILRKLAEKKRKRDVEEYVSTTTTTNIVTSSNKSFPVKIPCVSTTNQFKNDGSFLEQFRKLQEGNTSPANSNASSTSKGISMKIQPQVSKTLEPTSVQKILSNEEEEKNYVYSPEDRAIQNAVEKVAISVAVNGDVAEEVARKINCEDSAYSFLSNKNSDTYKLYQRRVSELVEARKRAEADGHLMTFGKIDEENNTLQTSRKRKKSRWEPENSQNDVNVMPAYVQRDQGLKSYAIQVFGSTDLTPEQWKQLEDQRKMRLLFEIMQAKQKEEYLRQLTGKVKYEYDSDEETDGGTWEHKRRANEMEKTKYWAEELTEHAKGKHHIGDFLPPEELESFLEKWDAVKKGRAPDLSDYKEHKITSDNIGYKMLQKLGWTEGSGLGADGGGIVEPVNKGAAPVENAGLGQSRPDDIKSDDDEYEAYRKRMMLAYRFRPNPLNNPRRPYY